MGQLLYLPLYVLYAALFLRLICRWNFFDISGVRKNHLVFFFLLKVTAGLTLTLVYTYYYTDRDKADIYRYFNDSKIISSVLFTNPLAWLKIITGIGTYDTGTFEYLHNTWHFTHPVGDFITTNAFLIRVISLLNYFSGFNIYIDTLLLNCITFMAITVIFKTLRPYFDEFQQILYIPFFIAPSFVFWSSGLLKEGLMFIGLALYLKGWLNNDKSFALRVILVLIGFFIVASTKIYVAAVLGLCSVFLPVNTDKRAVLWLARIACFAFIIFLMNYVSGANFCERVIDKRNEFILLGMEEHSNSALPFTTLTPDCGQLLQLLPLALFTAVVRPFFFEYNLFAVLFGCENAILFCFLATLLYLFYRKPAGKRLWLVFFCFSFAILNYIVIGITVPIIGAIVHYRIVAIPFLTLGVFLMIDLEKLKASVIDSLARSNIKL